MATDEEQNGGLAPLPFFAAECRKNKGWGIFSQPDASKA
jgi:hypothetical protein